MVFRRPCLYCKVCGKLVVIDILGLASPHFADGDNLKQIVCAGSEQAGLPYPGGR